MLVDTSDYVLQSLSHLDISGCSRHTAPLFAQVLKDSAWLKHLILRKNRFGSSASLLADALVDNTTLLTLNLSDGELDFASVQKFGQMLYWNSSLSCLRRGFSISQIQWWRTGCAPIFCWQLSELVELILDGLEHNCGLLELELPRPAGLLDCRGRRCPALRRAFGSRSRSCRVMPTGASLSIHATTVSNVCVRSITSSFTSFAGAMAPSII